MAVAGFVLSGSSVVFYNVENLFDTKDDPRTNDADFLPGSKLQWTEERLATKLDHLAEAITMTDAAFPALVGLAEVENREVVELLANEKRLRKAGYGVLHHDSPDERGIDVALLYKKDLFKVVRTEPLNVPLDNDHTRDILHAELNGGGHSFHIFVNHWPSRREGQEKSEPKRMAAAKVLRAAVDAIEASPKVHVLIMGDFNDTPLDRSIQEGLGAKCSFSKSALTDLMCVDQPEGSGSYQYQGDWQFLDQFLIGSSLNGHVDKAFALHDHRLLFKHPRYGPSPDKTYSGGHYKGGYSDHLPIVVTFR